MRKAKEKREKKAQKVKIGGKEFLYVSFWQQSLKRYTRESRCSV